MDYSYYCEKTFKQQILKHPKKYNFVNIFFKLKNQRYDYVMYLGYLHKNVIPYMLYELHN